MPGAFEKLAEIRLPVARGHETALHEDSALPFN
jgi:hypothetical protein